MIGKVGRYEKSVGSWEAKGKYPQKMEIYLSPADGQPSKRRSGKSIGFSYMEVFGEFRDSKRETQLQRAVKNE